MRIIRRNDEWRFYTQSGTALTRHERPAGTSEKWNSTMNDHARQDLAQIQPHIIEKPNWLRASERRARKFVRDLGFEATKGTQIACVDPKTDEEYDSIFECGLDGKPLAITYPNIGVLIPYQEAWRQYEHGGDLAVAPTIAHELIHTTERRNEKIGVVYDETATKFVGYMNRQGLAINKLGVLTGAILNEIPCEIAAGLYVRRRADPSAEFCSIDDAPESGRPAHYATNTLQDNGTPRQTGCEAYTVEMLSWKAHQLGLTATKNVLIEEFFAANSSDGATRLHALRAIPHIINGVKPSLYNYLRTVKYSDRADAMNNVYDIVSK